ncbi:MAG TPA: 4-hydroxythreonine-4-phosphate dehydrogenase PdxA [Blastocatellia bacterium]|nr:4-hydroxythreonine-4-phosphate dehydrogenase PdxA [Blastocatellia bacterium]
MTRVPDSPDKPRVGISIGDPAGIGPEIALKAAADARARAACRPVLIGSARELRRQASHFGLSCDYPALTESAVARGALGAASSAPLICDTGGEGAAVEWGRLSAAAGRAAIEAIETGVRLTLGRHLDALATAPINKEALKLTGSPFPGHTEMLAALTGSREVLMCFFAGNLRVFLLTIHVSLADAIRAITRERVEAALRLADRELRRLGIPRPRIAVAGLNPHAGEHGLFGVEEAREIAPAIQACRNQYDIEASGPFPADTLFVRAARGEFDAVAACYHDQGLIAVKCLAFGEAVNVTLGLPIIRTSVDHGTAFDIAGRGVADHQSLVEAITLAARLAKERAVNDESPVAPARGEQ